MNTPRRATAALTLSLLATTVAGTATSHAATSPTPAPAPAYTLTGGLFDDPGLIQHFDGGASAKVSRHTLVSTAPDGSVQLYGATFGGDVPSLASAVTGTKSTLLPDADALTDIFAGQHGEAGEGHVVRYNGKSTFYSYDAVTGKRTALAPFSHTGSPAGNDLVTYTATRDGAVVSTATEDSAGIVRSTLWKLTASKVTRLAVVKGLAIDIATTNGRIDIAVLPLVNDEIPRGSSITVMSVTGTTATTIAVIPGHSGRFYNDISLGYKRTGSTLSPMLAYVGSSGDSRLFDIAAGTSKTFQHHERLQVSAGAAQAIKSVRNPLTISASLNDGKRFYPANSSVKYGTTINPKAYGSISGNYTKQNVQALALAEEIIGIGTVTDTPGKVVRKSYHSTPQLRLTHTTRVSPQVTASPYLKTKVARTALFEVRHHLKVTTNKAKTTASITSVTADKIAITTRGSSAKPKIVTLPSSNTTTIALPKGSSDVTISALATMGNAPEEVTITR